MQLTKEDVREILRLLDESPYDELKLQTDRFSLTLKRGGGTGWTERAEVAPRPEATAAATQEVKTERAKKVGDASSADALISVYPPLPGVFYRAPKPGADPFVDIGAVVEENTTVGLIETMKLMNSVMAGCRGEVVEICAENGALVEVGDVLLRIRAA